MPAGRRRARFRRCLRIVETVRAGVASAMVLLQRRIIRGAHEVDLRGERNKILVSQFSPLGIGIEFIPSLVPGRTILVREKINQCFWISQVLPYGHDVHAVLLEYLDLAFSESVCAGR